MAQCQPNDAPVSLGANRHFQNLTPNSIALLAPYVHSSPLEREPASRDKRHEHSKWRGHVHTPEQTNGTEAMSTLVCEQVTGSDIAAPTSDELIAMLRNIVGQRHVLVGNSATRRYRKGFRFGDGPALAVVRPGSLREMWSVLVACHRANKILIIQAANTGLTGGSTPDGDAYDREIIIVSTMRLAVIHAIRNGEQVVCLPGATLFQLEKLLRPFNRAPHSVIGSSCIGASVCGGICNNSGGALIHRGPVFTQAALYAQVEEDGYAQVEEDGQIRLINHLGIRLGDNADEILARVEAGAFSINSIEDDPDRKCSDPDYGNYVRDIGAATPARFNADPKRLFEASGSAGKIMLLAARLDTFPRDRQVTDFYIGTNDPRELTEIRRHILSKFKSLPVECEYLHRDAFDIAEKYGKDTFLAIQFLGTDRLPLLFSLKNWLDSLESRFRFMPRDLSDHVMQFVSSLFPKHLPKRLYEYRDRFEHHLILRAADEGIAEARNYLSSIFPSSCGTYFECTPTEGNKAFLHRFAAAGAAVRYRAIHRDQVEDIVALDIALPRNGTEWFEILPQEITARLERKLYYGHFAARFFTRTTL